MKAFFIGGIERKTLAVLRHLSLDPEWEVYLLDTETQDRNLPNGIHRISADIDNDEEISGLLSDNCFDTVCNLNAYDIACVERDYRLFGGKIKQYLFISSASVYDKHSQDYRITENTALTDRGSPKGLIDCEDFLLKKYHETGFPVTIARTGQIYDESGIPVSVCGNKGFYQVIRRMQQGKAVIIHGDGNAFLTLTSADDLATGLAGLMGNKHAIGEICNISGDEVLTWNRIYAGIGDALGVKPDIYHISSDYLARIGMFCGYDFAESLLEDKAGSVIFDNTKLKRLVPGMTTNVPFSEGIRTAVDHIISHPEEYVEDPDFDRFCDTVTDALEETLTRLTISLYRQD